MQLAHRDVLQTGDTKRDIIALVSSDLAAGASSQQLDTEIIGPRDKDGG